MSVLLKLDHTVNSCVLIKSGSSNAMRNIPDISEFHSAISDERN